MGVNVESESEGASHLRIPGLGLHSGGRFRRVCTELIP